MIQALDNIEKKTRKKMEQERERKTKNIKIKQTVNETENKGNIIKKQKTS